MKILILTNFDIGLYKFRKELIMSLLKNAQVFIALPNGDYISELKSLGCHYIETKIDRRSINPVSDLKLLCHYILTVRRLKPDIVLGYTIKPNIYGGFACILTKTPYLSTITGLGTSVEKKGFIQKIALLLYKYSLWRSSCIYFQNTANYEFFQNIKLIKGKSKVIPGSGVNLEHFSIIEYPPSNTIEFVFISRIMKEKGIEEYLEAAKYITKKYPETRFHICGFCEEAYEEKLKYMHDKNIIQYHGMLRDVRELLRRTHCTVHPSYHEGLSNVLLESAACGRPIITTNVPGCREVVDNEVNGYIAKHKNSRDLADKIEKFIYLDYKAKRLMGLEGRKKVEREFDRNIVVEAYMNEINSICEGSG